MRFKCLKVYPTSTVYVFHGYTCTKNKTVAISPYDRYSGKMLQDHCKIASEAFLMPAGEMPSGEANS